MVVVRVLASVELGTRVVSKREVLVLHSRLLAALLVAH